MANNAAKKIIAVTPSGNPWGYGTTFGVGDRYKVREMNLPEGTQTALRDSGLIGGQGSFTNHQTIGQLSEQPLSFSGPVRGDDRLIIMLLASVFGQYGASTSTFVKHKMVDTFPLDSSDIEKHLKSCGIEEGEGSDRREKYISSFLANQIEFTYSDGLQFSSSGICSEIVQVTPSYTLLDSATYLVENTPAMFPLSRASFYMRPFTSSSWGTETKISGFTFTRNRNSASLGSQTGEDYMSIPVETAMETQFDLTVQRIQHQGDDNTLWARSQDGAAVSLKLIFDSGVEIGSTNQNYAIEMYFPKMIVRSHTTTTTSPSATTAVFEKQDSTTTPTGFDYARPYAYIYTSTTVAALSNLPTIS